MSILPDHPPSKADIGILGEDFVASMLQEQGWTILHRRWRCRWGELDIIAQQEVQQESRVVGAGFTNNLTLPAPLSQGVDLNAFSPMPGIIFVEVKTRSRGNWDADGREAIAHSKQAKLWSAATAFLAAYPEKASYPCRFDVACVSYQRISRALKPHKYPDKAVQISGYRLVLQDYIQSAFER